MKISDFDGWRNSPVGIWFFDLLREYADEAAKINGRAPGSYLTAHEDFVAFIRNAGHIDGIEYVINFDPFEEERNESEGNR